MADSTKRYSADSLETAIFALMRGYGAHETVARDLATSTVRTSLRGVG